MKQKFKVWDNKEEKFLDGFDTPVYMKDNGDLYNFQPSGMGESLRKLEPKDRYKVIYEKEIKK